MTLDSRPLGVDPDGSARWLVLVRFADAHGRPTRLLSGGNLEYSAWPGSAQWQTRARFAAPSAIVTAQVDGPLVVRVRSTSPLGLRDALARTDTRTWRGSRVAAKALGPHLVQVGWFPRERSGSVRVVRSDGGLPRTIGVVAPPSSTYRDESVRPGATYRYAVARPGAAVATFVVHVPAALRAPPVRVVGKGMYLTFSPSLLDDDAYPHLDPSAIVDLAARAGIRYLELRTAYGEYWEITPDARPTIDALIDRAAERGIAVVGWTVPRQASFADLAQSVATAQYRTARGTPLGGLAIDLERGDEYLGTGAAGYAAMADYSRLVRAALGDRFPVVAIVEDPYLEHLTNRDVPYAAIGATSSVLQPMTYWRMLSKGDTRGWAARRAIRASMAAVRREARSAVPITIGGQSSGLAGRSAPSPEEISASVDESRKAGALGISFFEWSGTSAAQWDAIGRYRW